MLKALGISLNRRKPLARYGAPDGRASRAACSTELQYQWEHDPVPILNCSVRDNRTSRIAGLKGLTCWSRSVVPDKLRVTVVEKEL
jgi:hypothetical protein